MEDFVDAEIQITINNFLEDLQGLVFGDFAFDFDQVLKSIVRAVVGDDVAGGCVVKDVVGGQDVRMVGELEGFGLVLEQVLGDLVGYIFKVDNFDGDLDVVGDGTT